MKRSGKKKHRVKAHLINQTRNKEMHEVLTLSLSPAANNLTTHFFNSQENYLDYTQSASKQSINTSTFLKQTLKHNTVNFSPRALLWDYRNGFGSLGQFEYAGCNEFDGIGDAQLVQTSTRLQKNPYQRALDAGEKLPTLNRDTVHYWSDFNRLIYEPRAFNQLKNWDYDPLKHPTGKPFKDFSEDAKKREFVGFETGVKEWQDVDGVEFLEDTYRHSLEETNLLNGLNVVTELDSAWAGFTSEMLADVRDNYNSKSEIFNWTIYNGKSNAELSSKELLERIRSFLALREHSSLVLPLSTKDQSLWYSSAQQNLVYESVQVLSCQKKDTISFAQFRGELMYGANNRDVISSMEAIYNGKTIKFTDSFFSTKKQRCSQPLKFSETTIHRHQQKPKDQPQRERQLFTETSYYSPITFPIPDSFPVDIIGKEIELKVKLTMDTSPRGLFLEWKDFVSKSLRGGDERSELIDGLSNLASDYENEWSHSDDEEYDDI